MHHFPWLWVPEHKPHTPTLSITLVPSFSLPRVKFPFPFSIFKLSLTDTSLLWAFPQGGYLTHHSSVPLCTTSIFNVWVVVWHNVLPSWSHIQTHSGMLKQTTKASKMLEETSKLTKESSKLTWALLPTGENPENLSQEKLLPQKLVLIKNQTCGRASQFTFTGLHPQSNKPALLNQKAMKLADLPVPIGNF